MGELSPAQSRAARGMLDWSQTQLASVSNLSESTIRDFEKGRRVPSTNNLAAIQRALEAAGVEFTNGDEPGVKMRRKPFVHDVTHLHDLWDREGLQEPLPESVAVEKLKDGLRVVSGDGHELGRITIRDGKLTLNPILPPKWDPPHNPDRLLPGELRTWVRTSISMKRA